MRYWDEARLVCVRNLWMCIWGRGGRDVVCVCVRGVYVWEMNTMINRSIYFASAHQYLLE